MFSSFCGNPELPAVLSAGDSWAWTVVLGSAVAAGSTLVYTFRAKGGDGNLTVTGTLASDGLSFGFAATADQTKGLALGIYSYIARLTAAGSTATIRNGTLKVLPNLADPNAETRTQAEIDLADAEATLRGLRKRTNGSFSSGDGVSYTMVDVTKLRAEVDRLRQQVRAERGQTGAVTIRTAFGSCWSARGRYPD